MELLPGVYETLINKAIEERISRINASHNYVERSQIDRASSSGWLANYLAQVVTVILQEKFADKDSTITISRQVDCVNQILKFIEEEWDYNAEEDFITDHSNFLRGIYNKVGLTAEQIRQRAAVHPMSGYRTSSLFTGGGKEVSVGSEIRLDIATADRIDLLVSFIKFRGWKLIADDIERFVKRRNTRLRVLTTTYMGATDVKALKEILRLREYGNVEVKAAFNTDQDRLHAKVYGFYRNSGYDTAYIGSSNLSKEAITTGTEWNIRITQPENPHILEKMKATFEQYWESEEFTPIATDDDLQRFAEAIDHIRHKDSPIGNNDINAPENIVTRYIRKNHQIRVLEQLKFERETKHSYRNLIVAATGTGKTAIAAFDFKDFAEAFRKREHREPRLLFVVHRKKILRQARYTFRSVLVNGNFGQLWVGDTRPASTTSLDHLFISIQTFNSNKETFRELPKDYYDYIVIDEAHHSRADSYRILFELFDPAILIGLTATPERMDGRSLLPDFNDRIASEIRLPEALSQQLLCPFDYYCVTDDSVDLSKVAFTNGKYNPSDLTQMYERNKETRFGYVQQALNKYINDPQSCKAVCFCCSIDHATSLNEQFVEHGYKSMVVTSNQTNRYGDVLEEAAEKLARGEINYLCVADMLNEGVDIPEIDTVLFMRPTESLTIFLQQLGRGLRLADNKTCLTVLDFIALAHEGYDYESRFRALVGKTATRIDEDIRKGFPFLPAGCSIKMEPVAREYILQNIKNSSFDLRRLRREVASFEQNSDLKLTIGNFLNHFSLDWRKIYKTPGSWSLLKQQAGLKMPGYERTKEVANLENGLTRLYHVNSLDFLKFISKLIDNGFKYDGRVRREAQFAEMFYYDVLYYPIDAYGKKFGVVLRDIADGIARLAQFPYFVEELRALVELRMQSICQTTQWLAIDDVDIELYGCYSADEIHLLTEGVLKRGVPLGTQYISSKKLGLVFVTLNKSDKEYSPTTLYKDYAVNATTFHWQSKFDVRANSKDGERFIQQKSNGWKFLLFVRDTKQDSFDLTNAYYCLGLMDYVAYSGECPMNITWSMQRSIPGFILEKSQAV